jgi:enoyl-CoA hydratase
MEHAAAQGVSSAVAQRDGKFGDYSQAPPDRKPDPSHIIEP